MALTPETGSGVDNADTYASLSEFSTFLTARNQGSGKTDAEKEASLRRAFEYLEGAYGRRWVGERTNLSVLRSSWPRVSAFDAEGRNYSGIVPSEVKTAQMLLAVQDFETPLDEPLEAPVSSETAGEVSVTYAVAPTGTAQEARYPIVERRIAHLLKGAGDPSRMERY